MAQNNIETDIKKSLEQRRLQPSAQAWTKLQSQLDGQDQKRSTNRYWYIGIAAGFIGILLIGTWMFKTNSSTHINVVDVESPVENIEKVTESFNTNSEEVVASSSNKADSVEPLKKDVSPKTKITPTSTAKQSTVIAEVLEEEHLIPEDTLSNTLIAQESIAVNDDYIEALLQQAEQQISTEKALINAQHTVDADALLESVENDIEHSFREKVFDAVKSGFVKVKTAVVDRND
ncbi:hypothetical protein [Formosa algae]|uniref:hypothetical protein n=1 Tax=Formosa algae TaxID=225843 RepID=UPI000CCE5D5D|nr:hypothetical protein [Formosa algae]PNW29925.1 hypothetical protein BKP44_02070 [Formosa algae]